MKSLITFILLLFFSINLISCDFDSQRQVNLHYPITLEVINTSAEKISVDSIYNSADTTSGFVLKGDKASSGKKFELKISKETSDVISSGKYYLEGSCGNIKDWLVDGKHLEKSVIHNEHEWKITITVEDCGKLN